MPEPRVCKKCGHVVPWQTNCRACPICHTRFPDGVCYVCGRYTPHIMLDNTCRPCHNRAQCAYHTRVSGKIEDQYDEWLRSIRAIKPPYKPLTTEEWLEACKHFGGCALCGAEEIQARTLFIRFTEGGKYCAWNVVPTCEKCATSLKGTKSHPFRSMSNWAGDNARKGKQHLDGYLQAIVDYLEPKMEEARWHKGKD